MSSVVSKQVGFVKLLNEFLNIKGNKFVNLKYRNKKGELSEYLLMVGVNLKNSYLKDIKKLERVKPKDETEAQALSELLVSMRTSVETNFNNPAYTKLDYYDHINKNVKVNDNNFYLNAFVLNKKVIEPIEYPKVNSAPKTIAKNKLKKDLRVSKFREFILDLDNISKANLNGKRFEVISL
jgi:hypothetical protein